MASLDGIPALKEKEEDEEREEQGGSSTAPVLFPHSIFHIPSPGECVSQGRGNLIFITRPGAYRGVDGVDEDSRLPVQIWACFSNFFCYFSLFPRHEQKWVASTGRKSWRRLSDTHFFPYVVISTYFTEVLPTLVTPISLLEMEKGLFPLVSAKKSSSVF